MSHTPVFWGDRQFACYVYDWWAVFALCQRFPFTSGCILHYGTGAFRILSSSINEPSNVAAGAVSVCCSRVVCMVCRLSIPSNGIYIRFFSFNVFCTLILYIL